MDNLLFKTGNSGQVNVDQAQGIVECFVAGIGNKDSVGDVVISGAFAKSLTHRKPRVVWGHSWNDPIGKVLEMFEVPVGDSRLPAKMRNAGIGGLYAKVQFNLQSEKGKEAFATVAFFGEDQEWSIGYKTIDAIFDPNLQANILKEVELYEVSPVLHGANQLTGTISIKADEKGHMPIIPMQGNGVQMMPTMNQMPRIVVVAAPTESADESTLSNPFAEGMSRELQQPAKNSLEAELTDRTGSKIEVMNATENIVVFRRTTSDGKASMYRLPYHNEGGLYMFGKPEPYEADVPKPQLMQNIEQKPGAPVVVPNGGIAYRNDDQQEMMNMFGGSVESPFGKSEISHLIELPEEYMTSARDFMNPVLRHHKLVGRPSSKGIIVDGLLTASALDALQNAVKALGATLGQTSGNIGQAIGKIRDLAQTFNPYALDGDGDGFVQDGSAFARPYIPIKKPGFDLPDVRGRKRSGDALLDKPQLTSGGLPKDKNKWTPEQRKEGLLGGLIEPETRDDVAFLANRRPTNEGVAKYWDMSEADLTKEGNRLINARKQSAGADKERIDQELLKVSHDFSRRASYAETFGQEFVPPAKRAIPNLDLVPIDITQNESIRRMLGAPKSKIPRTDEGFASRYDKYTDMFDTLVEQTEIDPSSKWNKLDEDSQIEFIKELDYDYMYDVHGDLGDDGIVEAMESGEYDDEINEFAEGVWNSIAEEKKLTADKERRLLDQEESEDPRNIADAEEAARIEREELEEERTERFRPTLAELAMEAEADDDIDDALETFVGEQPFGDEESGFASRGEPPIDPPDPELSDEFIEDYLTDNLSMGELELETLEKYNNSDINPLQKAVILDLYERYTSEDNAVSAEAVDEILKRFYTELVNDNYDSMVEAKNYRPDYDDDGFASRGEPFGFASRDNDGDVKQDKLDEMIEGVRTRLLEELETADPSTWKPSWRNDSLPINATTGKPYRGWNSFWLMLRTSGADYQTGRYATYNQLIARGAQVRKGEKGVPILRPQLMKRTDKDGNEKEWIKFYGATVFNIDQADGGDEALRAIVADLPEEQRIKILEATIAELGVSVKTDNMSGPHYSPTGDYVSMPDFSKGTSALDWNSTLAHETIHWTGGASRLNRPSVANYSDSKQIRAYEELVAEVGSAMFLAAHGIDAPFREDHAPYIKGWISLLKDDPDALARAFKDATAAMNYVLEKSPNLRKLFGGTDSGKKAPEVDVPDLVGAAVNSSEGFASLHRVRTPRSKALGGILYDDSSRELMVGFLKGKPWDDASPEDRDIFIDRAEAILTDGNRSPSASQINDYAEELYDDARDIGWYVYSDVDMPEVEELAIVRSKGKHINALKKLKKARKATDEDQFNFFGRDEKMQDVSSSKMNDGFASRGPKEPQEGLRRHKLMPAEIRGKIPQLDTTEEVPTDEKVLAVKFFSPYSDWTWYGVEFDGEDMFFGYVEGFEKEWGYFSLDELAKTQLGGMVPAVERDTGFRPTKFGDLNKADGFASRGSKRLGVEPKHTDPTWVDKTQRRILRQDTDWGSLSYDDQIDWANSFLQEFIEENEMGHDLTDLMNGRRLNTRPDIGLMNYAESAYARMSDSHSRRRAQFGERPDGESDGFASVGSRTRRLGMQPSEAVDYVSYDPDSENLFVAYKREDGRGDMYVYEGVSMDDAVALENAPSAGRAINDIKRRKNVRKATSDEVVGLSKPLTGEGNASKKAKTFKLIDDIYGNPEHRANRDIQLEINADRISVEDDGTVTWESNDNTRRYTISPTDDGRYLVTSEKLSRGGREEPDTFDTVSSTVEDSRENAIASLIETAKSKIADDDEDSRLDRELADVTRELDMAGDAPGVESIDVTYSTALDAVDYNPATKEMRISYKDGGTYIYEGVDADEVDAFKSAPSKGRATNDIKRAHSFRKDSEWSGGGDDDFDIEEFDVSGSEAVEQVSYDPEKEDLMVVYAGGKGYVYSGVTREEANAFRSAPSKGRAINDIKRTHEVRMLTGEDVRFFGSKKAGEFTPSEIRDDEEYSKDELRSFIEEQEGLLEVMDLNGESAAKLAQQIEIINKAKRDLLASDPAPVAAPKMPTSRPPRGGKRVRNRSVAIEMEQGTLDEIIDAEKQGITVDELRAASGGRGGKYTKGPRKGKYRGPDTITVRDSKTGELLHSNEILLTSSASPGSPSSANRKRGYIRARSYVGRQGHTTTKDEGPSLRGDGKGMTDYDKRVYGLGSDEKNRDAGLASSGGRVRERGNRIGQELKNFRNYLDSEYGEYFMEYTQMDDEELKQTLMGRYRMSRGEARDLARQIRRDEKQYYEMWEQEDLQLNDLDALGYDGDVDGFASLSRIKPGEIRGFPDNIYEAINASDPLIGEIAYDDASKELFVTHKGRWQREEPSPDGSIQSSWIEPSSYIYENVSKEELDELGGSRSLGESVNALKEIKTVRDATDEDFFNFNGRDEKIEDVETRVQLEKLLLQETRRAKQAKRNAQLARLDLSDEEFFADLLPNPRTLPREYNRYRQRDDGTSEKITTTFAEEIESDYRSLMKLSPTELEEELKKARKARSGAKFVLDQRDGGVLGRDYEAEGVDSLDRRTTAIERILTRKLQSRDGEADGFASRGQMAASKEQIKKLRNAITSLDTPERRAKYLRGDYPRSENTRNLDIRYAFDLFNEAVDAGYLSYNDFENLNDAQKFTAIRNVVPKLARNEDGFASMGQELQDLQSKIQRELINPGSRNGKRNKPIDPDVAANLANPESDAGTLVYPSTNEGDYIRVSYNPEKRTYGVERIETIRGFNRDEPPEEVVMGSADADTSYEAGSLVREFAEDYINDQRSYENNDGRSATYESSFGRGGDADDSDYGFASRGDFSPETDSLVPDKYTPIKKTGLIALLEDDASDRGAFSGITGSRERSLRSNEIYDEARNIANFWEQNDGIWQKYLDDAELEVADGADERATLALAARNAYEDYLSASADGFASASEDFDRALRELPDPKDYSSKRRYMEPNGAFNVAEDRYALIHTRRAIAEKLANEKGIEWKEGVDIFDLAYGPGEMGDDFSPTKEQDDIYEKLSEFDERIEELNKYVTANDKEYRRVRNLERLMLEKEDELKDISDSIRLNREDHENSIDDFKRFANDADYDRTPEQNDAEFAQSLRDRYEELLDQDDEFGRTVVLDNFADEIDQAKTLIDSGTTEDLTKAADLLEEIADGQQANHRDKAEFYEYAGDDLMESGYRPVDLIDKDDDDEDDWSYDDEIDDDTGKFSIIADEYYGPKPKDKESRESITEYFGDRKPDFIDAGDAGDLGFASRGLMDEETKKASEKLQDAFYELEKMLDSRDPEQNRNGLRVATKKQIAAQRSEIKNLEGQLNSLIRARRNNEDGFASSGGETRKSDLTAVSLRPGNLLPNYFPTRGGYENLMKRRERDPNYEMPPVSEVLAVAPMKGNPGKLIVTTKNIETGDTRKFEINKNAKLRDVRIPIDRNKNEDGLASMYPKDELGLEQFINQQEMELEDYAAMSKLEPMKYPQSGLESTKKRIATAKRDLARIQKNKPKQVEEEEEFLESIDGFASSDLSVGPILTSVPTEKRAIKFEHRDLVESDIDDEMINALNDHFDDLEKYELVYGGVTDADWERVRDDFGGDQGVDSESVYYSDDDFLDAIVGDITYSDSDYVSMFNQMKDKYRGGFYEREGIEPKLNPNYKPDGFASRGAPNRNNMGFGPMDDEYWTTSDRGGRKTWDGTDAERGTTWTIQMTDQFDYEVSGSFDNGFGDEEVIDFGTEESYDDLEGAKRFVEGFEVDDDDDFQPSDSDIFTEQEMMDDFRDSDDGFASRGTNLSDEDKKEIIAVASVMGNRYTNSVVGQYNRDGDLSDSQWAALDRMTKRRDKESGEYVRNTRLVESRNARRGNTRKGSASRDSELAEGMVASEIESNYARLSDDDQMKYFQRALANNADSGLTSEAILKEAKKLAMDDREMAQLERQAVGMGGSSEPRKIDVSSSSALNYVAYDATNRSLDVEYRGRDGKGTGTLYSYKDVDPEIVDSIENSDSRGATIRQVRDNYEFTTSQRLPDSAYEGLASRSTTKPSKAGIQNVRKEYYESDEEYKEVLDLLRNRKNQDLGRETVPMDDGTGKMVPTDVYWGSRPNSKGVSAADDWMWDFAPRGEWMEIGVGESSNVSRVWVKPADLNDNYFGNEVMVMFGNGKVYKYDDVIRPDLVKLLKAKDESGAEGSMGRSVRAISRPSYEDKPREFTVVGDLSNAIAIVRGDDNDGFASSARPTRQDDPIAYFKYLVDRGAFDPDSDDAFDYIRDEGLPMSLLSYGEGRGGSESRRKFPESTATYGGSGLSKDEQKEILETLKDSSDPFIKKVVGDFYKRGRLSDKQWATLKGRADREKKKAAPKKPSGFVSNVRNGGTIAPGAAPSGIVTPTREQIADIAGLEKIISDAKYNGRALRFNYNGKNREVTPVQTYTNPKTGKVNMVGQDAEGVQKTFTIDKMSPSTEMASSTADGFASRGSKRPKSRWSAADRQRFADGNILRSRKQQGKRRQGPSANEFDGFASRTVDELPDTDVPFSSVPFEGGEHGPGKDISLKKMWENYRKYSKARGRGDSGNDRWLSSNISIEEAVAFFGVDKNYAAKILQARDPNSPELFIDDPYLASEIGDKLGFRKYERSGLLFGFEPLDYYDDEGNRADTEDEVDAAIAMDRARREARIAARQGRRTGKINLTKGQATIQDLEDALKKIDPKIKLTGNDGESLSPNAMRNSVMNSSVRLPWSLETYRRIRAGGGALSPAMVEDLVDRGLFDQSSIPERNDLAISEALQWPGFKKFNTPQMIDALSDALGLDRAEIAKMHRTIGENLTLGNQGRRVKRSMANIQKAKLKLTKEKIAKMMESLGLSVEEFDEWFKNAPFTGEIVGSNEAVRT